MVIQDVVTVPVSMATVSASVLGAPSVNAGSVTFVARLDSVSIVERRHNSPSEMGILKGVTISPCELGYIAELLPSNTWAYIHIHSARVYILYLSRNELRNFTTYKTSKLLFSILLSIICCVELRYITVLSIACERQVNQYIFTTNYDS